MKKVLKKTLKSTAQNRSGWIEGHSLIIHENEVKDFESTWSHLHGVVSSFFASKPVEIIG